jgi:hypothetical protein
MAVSGRVEAAPVVLAWRCGGSGSDWSEVPVFRVSAGHAGLKSRP